jgi:hypothetical protein
MITPLPTTLGIGVQEVDWNHLHAWLVADALPPQVPMASHVLLSTFETLAMTGAREAELAAYRHRVKDAYESPAGPVRLLESQARAVLNGKPPRSAADSIRLAAEVIPADVAKTAQALRSSILVAAPYDVPAIQGRMGRVPPFSTATITGGRVYRPTAGDSPALTVSDEGVMLTRAPGEHVTVRYADAAALLRWNDGEQSLIGGDGFTVTLDPRQWKNGAAALAAVTARIPDELVVPLAQPGPGTSKPRATPTPQTGAGQQAGPKRRPRLAHIVSSRAFVVTGVALLLLGVAAWAASSGSALGLSPAVAAIAVLLVPRLTRRRRRH